MAWGLTPDGLADFNRLVGVEHLLRPFELERVNLPAVRDPILSGLTVRDVAMESGEQMFPWAGDKYLVDDEFTYVVDFDDIAPFCEFPGTQGRRHGRRARRRAGWARNMVNGFTSADSWKLIHYMDTKPAAVTLKLPREETVDRLEHHLERRTTRWPRRSTSTSTTIPSRSSLATKPNAERQDFSIRAAEGRQLVDRAGRVRQGPVTTTGIDNLWVHVPASGRLAAAGPAAVEHRRPGEVSDGRGRRGAQSASRQAVARPCPVNAQKKQVIVATLLRNLHATFAGGTDLDGRQLEVPPAAVGRAVQPVSDQGPRLVRRRPRPGAPARGQAGLLRRVVPDPRFPHLAVALLRDAGRSGARGQLPSAVKGLKAGVQGRRALLPARLQPHGRVAPPAARAAARRSSSSTSSTMPTARRPTCRCCYGEGADHWISKEPAGLAAAALAWAAPFPGDKSGEQAAVYQFSWTNPRPEVPIESIDMLYGPSGSQYGTPALLAITAAEEGR